MIALDTSAIVAIAMSEPEEPDFSRLIVIEQALVGTPTLVEARIVLTSRMPAFAESFMTRFVQPPLLHPVRFTYETYQLAAEAYDRYGKGGGHSAQLNFGDCMAYAVAKHFDVPLLYKGNDFAHTDIRPALP